MQCSLLVWLSGTYYALWNAVKSVITHWVEWENDLEVSK